MAKTSQTTALADFSEGLTKGVGFKFTKTTGEFVDFRLKDAPPAVPLSVGKTSLFNLAEGGQAKYSATDKQIKEDIVLDQRPLFDAVRFGFASSDLVAEKQEDGSHILYALDSSTTTYTYDANANISSITGPGKTVSFGYGADNRLAGSTINGQYTGYSYDDSGNMTHKTPPGGNVNYTWFPVFLIA